jgi:hypothetical protein
MLARAARAGWRPWPGGRHDASWESLGRDGRQAAECPVRSMLNGAGRRLVWFRLVRTWRARRSSYLGLVLISALLGGLAMGAVSAARRTQSSYPALLASTNPSQLQVLTAVDTPGIGNGRGYNPAVVARLARLRYVAAVGSVTGLDLAPLNKDGAPVNIPYLPVSAGNAEGSVGGENYRIDRLVVLAGRLPDPSALDEFATLPSAARAFGFHLGQEVEIGVYTNHQTELAGFGTASVRPFRRIAARLVGLVEPAEALVADETDALSELGYFTPALTRELIGCCANYTETGIVARPGHLRQVEAELAAAAPTGLSITGGDLAASSVAKAERAIRPESIALGVFGGIVGLAALLIAAQMIGRQRRRDAAEAVALSPLSPLGPVRPVDPNRGVAFDWTVLALGSAALLLTTAASAVLFAWRGAPHRSARRPVAARGVGVARLTELLRLRPAAAVGTTFALNAGPGRDGVPVRSAILGATLATVALLSTVTFGSSLDTLVSTPRLYGWNWNYDLTSGGGDIPGALAQAMLASDPHVAAFSGVYFAELTIDGRTVPVIGTAPGARVQPPVLSGHGLEGDGQIVLGPLTLAQLHKRVGERVVVSAPGEKPRSLRIVGTATLPAIGGGGGGVQHLEMGSGAVLPALLIPPLARNPFNNPVPGPNAYFVDTKPGAGAGARNSLEAMTGPLSNTANFGVSVVRVLRPAEIVNYRSLGTTPAILGSVLGAGAVGALALTLVASVRRRRRDLALLKTLGFTTRQLAVVVLWQANVAVLIGVAVGLPLGIAAGRALWDAFARQINAVPMPVVSAGPVVAIAALALATLVSLLPAVLAARTTAAVGLRDE